jgi:hypothetical protein
MDEAAASKASHFFNKNIMIQMPNICKFRAVTVTF